ncbi:hypothetical protein DITRI_Ditri14bG0153200 [Diplodiscus trichospermus]
MLCHFSLVSSFLRKHFTRKVLQENNVIPGIKVDKGTVDIAGTNGETTTQGFDSLGARCQQYYKAGARLAKWRAVLKIAPNEPSELAIQQNAQGWLVMQSFVRKMVLFPLLSLSSLQSVERSPCSTLEGTLLKPNMVTSGSDSPKVSPQVIAEYTVAALRRTVPPAVPGIVFLSGGQSEVEATVNLDAMNKLDVLKPWTLSFSFGRALQQSTRHGEERRRMFQKHKRHFY